MIRKRPHNPIASWWFEDRRQPAPARSATDLAELLNKCQVAVSALRRHDLLIVDAVHFSGWTTYDPSRDEITRVERPDTSVDVPANTAPSRLAAFLLAAIARDDVVEHSLYPTEIEFSGRGVLLDSNGEKSEFKDVTSLVGRTLDVHVVEVQTHTDVWLPYTLTAKPQPSVWRYNAPRLEQALMDIQRDLGVSPNIDSHDKYVVYDGLRVVNHSDADNNVVEIELE